MEQIHTKAFEAIQPFIHLATSTTSPSPRFLATLITNATSSPNTFVFAELLEAPAIQSLRSPETPAEYQPYLTLLEIFAWGTWQEYQTTPNLPRLNDAQSHKLRLLSLLTLSKTHNPLTYSTAIQSLSLSSHADLESLVTKAIFSSLISARLSPTTSPPIIKVNSVAPLRDIRPQSISTMISVLSEWQDRCRDVIGGIESEIAKIRADAERRYAREHARAERLERSVSGWNGDEDGSAGDGNAGGAGSKRSLRPSTGGSGRGGRKSGRGGGNKREFNATDGVETRHQAGRMGSEMDIDADFDGEDSERLTRNAKRMLGISGRSS
ncbi:hypothetical protein PRK78_003117 [Emydomyces testavorans]|uniref:PCI domain-containing protein n=1 Tax=Emydomyces testavorans TaxID=2070801 RepID=A0AAF0DH75_9EURO|nr:hypothetical protein PRK78_003117 [Emydomyces testavorans]